jgi:hypothetical protein
MKAPSDLQLNGVRSRFKQKFGENIVQQSCHAYMITEGSNGGGAGSNTKFPVTPVTFPVISTEYVGH